MSHCLERVCAEFRDEEIFKAGDAGFPWISSRQDIEIQKRKMRGGKLSTERTNVMVAVKMSRMVKKDCYTKISKSQMF